MFSRSKNEARSPIDRQYASIKPVTTLQLIVSPRDKITQKQLSKTQPILSKNNLHKNDKKSAITTKYNLNKKQQTQLKGKFNQKKSISLDNDDVVKIIQESENFIKNNQLIEGINLLKALKDPSIKINNPNLLLVVLMNLAVTYYQTGFLEEAFQDFQTLSQKLSQLSLNSNSAGKPMQKLKYLTVQAKVELQICILFSQMGKHEQALKHARKSCKINFQLIYDVLNYLCKTYIKTKKTNQREQSKKKTQTQMDQNILNNILLLEHLHKLIGDLNQIFHVPQKIKLSKQLLNQVKNYVSNFKALKVDMEMLFCQNQLDDEKSQKLQWIYHNKILDQIQLKSLSPLYFQTQNPIDNAEIVEKIIYLAISFYCYSTQIRFIQKTKENVDEDEVLDSQHWLSRSLQIAYSLMPPNAPILNQILTVHDRFHGIDKQTIPQDKQIRGFFKVLKPLSKPKSTYSSKSHMCSPIMIRIQAPKLTIDIQQPSTNYAKKRQHMIPKSLQKVDLQETRKIIDLDSLTKNNKIKGLNSGIKILEFNHQMNTMTTLNQINKLNPNKKIISRNTISDSTFLQSDKQKKIRISKIYNSHKKTISDKYIDFKEDKRNLTDLQGKAILSEDLLHRPHSYDKNINHWQKIQQTSKVYTTQKRRKSLPIKNKQKLQKLVYNGSLKFDGLKLTGKRLNETFQIDSTFLEKLSQAHQNQQAIIQNAKNAGGNIFINNNINLFISKGNEGYPKTTRQNTQNKDQMSKRQRFISKRRLSHLNVYPNDLSNI